MELSSIWSIFLSFVSTALLFWVKVSHDEVKRLGILLSKTREENAEKYVTKAEVHADINRVLDRIDKLGEKLDRIMEMNSAK